MSAKRCLYRLVVRAFSDLGILVKKMKKTIINPLFKDSVTFTQTAAETNGRITSLSVTQMPGGGPPMHYHRKFTETFIVLEGRLTIVLKDRTIQLSAGERYTVRKKEVHRFLNQSGLPVVFTTLIQPASPGFEKALCILYGLADDGRTDSNGIPRHPLELAAISRMSDMHQPGLKVILAPVLSLLACIARITKVDQKLIARYCGNS